MTSEDAVNVPEVTTGEEELPGSGPTTCRLCASTDNMFDIPVFNNDTGFNIPELIFNCVSIQIKETDILPKNICNVCLEQLTGWLNFKNKCVTSQTALCQKFNVDPEKALESQENSESKETPIENTEVKDKQAKAPISAAPPQTSQSVPVPSVSTAEEDPGPARKKQRVLQPEEVEPIIPIYPVKTEPVDDEEEEVQIEDSFMRDEESDEVLPKSGGEGSSKNQNEENAWCNICNKWYTNNRVLQRHYQTRCHKSALSELGRKRNPVSVQRRIVPIERSFQPVHEEDSQPMVRTSQGFSRFGRKTGRLVDENFYCTDTEVSRLQNKQVVNNRNTYLKEARAARVHYCDVCDSSFGQRADLERHFLSQRHKNNANMQNCGEERYYNPPSSSSSYRYQEQEYQRSSSSEGNTGMSIFACPIEDCDLKFSSGILLISHMKDHGIATNITATQTVKTEPHYSSDSSDSNMGGESSATVIKCDWCDETFNSIVGKTNHMRNCRERWEESVNSRQLSKTYCIFCNIDFKEVSAFENHVFAKHKGARMYKHIIEKKRNSKQPRMNFGQIDNGGISSSESLLRVRSAALDQRSGHVKCNHCHKVFDSPRSLYGHMLKMHPNYKRQYVPSTSGSQASAPPPAPIVQQQFEYPLSHLSVYKCKVCGARFNNSRSFGRHLRTHYPADEELTCDCCGASFESRNELNNHKAYSCPDSKNRIKIFTCNICRNSYNSQAALDHHKETEHTTVQRKPENTSGTMCSICHKDFATRGSLNRHRRTVHGERTDHEEEEQPRYQGHIDPETVNAEPFPTPVRYTCRYCKRSMSRKSYLHKHITSTCPVKVFNFRKCVVCERFLNPKFLDGKSTCNMCMISTPPGASGIAVEIPPEDVEPPARDEYRDMSRQHDPATESDMSAPFDSSVFCTTVLGGEHSYQKAEPSPSTAVVKKATCDICHAMLRHQKDLENHRKTYKGLCKESGLFDKVHGCIFCGRDDLYAPQLYKHVYSCARKYTQMKTNVPCPLNCDMVFSKHDRVEDLVFKIQEHILICCDVDYHKSQNPEELVKRSLCRLCCTVFTSQDNMRDHLNVVHYGKPKNITDYEEIQDPNYAT